MGGKSRSAYLALELFALFIVIPTIYLCFRPMLPHPIPVMWCSAAVCYWMVKRDGRENCLGALPDKKQVLMSVARFAAMALVLGILVALFEPGKLFVFPSSDTAAWIAFTFLYPLLSAFPQAIVFRLFVFHRYKDLFGDGRAMITASALVFCYAHIIYGNPVALVLTLFGGFIFASSYARNSSLLFSSVEHGLYGDFIFTIGLGCYICSV